MDTEEEDILAIRLRYFSYYFRYFMYKFNMVDAFTNFQMNFIFSIRNYCKNKTCTKYFAFADK